MMNKNTQRIVIAIIAVMLAIIMILSMVAPALAAEGQEPVEETALEADVGNPAEDEALPDNDGTAGQDGGSDAVSAEASLAGGEGDAGDAEAAAADSAGTSQTDNGNSKEGAASKDAAAKGADKSEAGKASDISLDADQNARILDGVKIGEVDVSGMTEEEANAAVNAHVAEMQSSVLTAKADGQEMFAAVSDLGFAWTNQNVVSRALALGRKGNILERYKARKDLAVNGIDLPIEREFSSEAMHGFISQCAATVNRLPVEHDLQMNPDGTIAVVEGSNGIQVDEASSYSAMLLYMNTGWRGGAPEFALTTTVLPPQRDLAQLSLVKDVIGTGDTDYSGSSAEREQNILNGTNLVSGHVLMPGEQFSLLEHVVPFTAENGYAPAPSYAEGSVIDTFGGGICQVSTTLYLAVLQAELQVDERFCHSMMVQYIEPSKDAAISEDGGKDLKFTNNTDAPIYIHGSAGNNALHFSIYGMETRPADRIVQYISNVLSQTDVQFIFLSDENLPAGTVIQSGNPHIGYEAELWKETTWNGETTREWINESSYRMTPITITVGVQTADQALKDSLMGAVAAEQLDQINGILVGAGLMAG
ncbi:MAG: VanW family protein [Lachnospiraceae bacterium]|nr:VanW family protein [Lachnospiraceae bacterium]